jgi:hypothetical protein
VGAEDLDRYSLAILIQSQVDDAHPALAQALEQAVLPDSARFAYGRIDRHATTVRPPTPAGRRL